MVNSLVSYKDKEKYVRFLFRSYIENDKKIKWCPAPGCNCAVNFEIGSSNYDVSCTCAYSFCWNCTEETHRPVDCETVKKWMVKSSAESGNTTWLLVNSKPCPQCKRPIEKNNGCMHMVCSLCKFQFCWLCLGDWSAHGKNTGGYYACNQYAKAKRDGLHDEAIKKRQKAKNELKKYMHYYERWDSNQKARKKAIEDLHGYNSGKLEQLSTYLSTTVSSLKIVTDAWEQIVECRRVLKWTYAYGYYLPEKEVARKHLFEYLQGEAESALEQLHKCAEKELNAFITPDNPSEPSKEFIDFCSKLIDLTKVTKQYFNNLVSAFETNLQEVTSSRKVQNRAPKASKASEDKEHCGGKKPDGKKKNGTGSQGRVDASADDENWRCLHCAFANLKSTNTCAVCETEKG